MRGENQVGWAPRCAAGALAVVGLLVIAPDTRADSSEALSCRTEAAPAALSAAGEAAPELCQAAPSEAPMEGLGGMWVQMDRNGNLEAMASEGATPPNLGRLLSQNSRGLRVEQRKSGRISMALNGRFLRAIVAHVDENGNIVTSCDSDLPEGHAHAAVSEGAPATSGREE